MTANTVVNVLSVLWIAMTVSMILLGALAFQIDDAEFGAALFVTAGILWSASTILALIVMGCRLFLQKRLTGMSIWLGWVPPIGLSISITGFAIFGLLVD